MNHREKNLNDWQQSLLLKEQNLNEYQNNLYLYEKTLHIEKEKQQFYHCDCCQFNKNMPLNNSDSIYAEWGIFKRSMNNEARLNNNWLNTDISRNYKENKLIAVYVTKLDLS